MTRLQRPVGCPELGLSQLEPDQVEAGSGRPTLPVVRHVQQMEVTEGLPNQTAHQMQRQICRLCVVRHF